jgi:tetratricopeptide (TPR) repeat protein
MKHLIPLSFMVLTMLNVVAQQEPEAMRLARHGMAKVEANDLKGGLDLLQKARNAMPGSYEISMELGRTHLLMGNAAKAEKVLYPLTFHADVDATLYPILGQCYMALKKYRQSAETFRYGLEKWPDDGALYAGLGRAYVAIDSLERASAAFETGTAKSPTFAENYLLAARLLEEKHPLWAWVYAETYLNLSDDRTGRRDAALIVYRNLRAVTKGNGKATDSFGQAMAAAIGPCHAKDTELASMAGMYVCMASATLPVSPLGSLWAELHAQGLMEAYAYHMLGEADKDAFTLWAQNHAPMYAKLVGTLQRGGLQLHLSRPFNRIEH